MDELTVVFDLDGTLVDTAPDLIRCTNHVLASAGVPAVAPSYLRPMISFGARRMIEAGLAFNKATASEAGIEDMLAAFLSHYETTIADASRPFPDVERVLDGLAANGARVAICTNKTQAMAIALLDALKMSHRFAAIAGRDTFATRKPHPDHLLNTIARAGGSAHRAIMVGDSDVDIATAKAAGVPVIAVTFGYSEHPVAAYQPDATVSHYNQFPAALAGMRAKFRV